MYVIFADGIDGFFSVVSLENHIIRIVKIDLKRINDILFIIANKYVGHICPSPEVNVILPLRRLR